MGYFKTIQDGYILAISTGCGQIPIDKEEYDSLMDIILSAPLAPDGYTYMLRADNLEWELHELPPIQEPSDIDNDEIVSILLGGEME